MVTVNLKELGSYTNGDFAIKHGEVVQVSEEMALQLESTGYFDVNRVAVVEKEEVKETSTKRSRKKAD